MSEKIHAGEPDTSEAVVRAVLEAQCPEWAGRPLAYLQNSGSSNALWRVTAPDGDLVVRLPRNDGAAESVELECAVQPALAETSLAAKVRLPEVRHVGRASEDYRYPWAVFGWLDGQDLWSARDSFDENAEDWAIAMAAVVRTIGELKGVPVEPREAGGRGGPMRPLLAALDWWLTDPQWNSSAIVDVPAIRRLMDEAAEVADDVVAPVFVHGDLIPGNLLTHNGELHAVIDWGCAALADPAQDLSPAWAVFGPRGRQVFREAVGADDASWLRARTYELEHAVSGIVYYEPKGHALGDVMRATLNRILDEA